MYTKMVVEIPEQNWFNDLSREIVKDFNDYAKEHNAKLVLDFYSEPESESEFEVMLDNGYYDYIYPENNIHTPRLKELINDAEEHNRFLGFDTTDLW